MILRIALTVAAALVAVWVVLVLAVWRAAPRGERRAALPQALRLLPDIVRLVRRLAADRTVPRGVRTRLWLLLAYLALPIDVVPDFIPVVGYFDDVVVVVAVLRSVVRRAGADVVAARWPGSPDGLDLLWRLAGLPGTPPVS